MENLSYFIYAWIVFQIGLLAWVSKLNPLKDYNNKYFLYFFSIGDWKKNIEESVYDKLERYFFWINILITVQVLAFIAYALIRFIKIYKFLDLI